MPAWLNAEIVFSRLDSKVLATNATLVPTGIAILARMRTEPASTSTVTAEVGTPAASARISRVCAMSDSL